MDGVEELPVLVQRHVRLEQEYQLGGMFVPAYTPQPRTVLTMALMSMRETRR